MKFTRLWQTQNLYLILCFQVNSVSDLCFLLQNYKRLWACAITNALMYVAEGECSLGAVLLVHIDTYPFPLGIIDYKSKIWEISISSTRWSS